LTTESQSARPATVESAAARDAELIRRILDGERELFHELVRPYEKSVYYATFSILQNQQNAEDAAQETVLKALKNLHSFRAESKFSTWLISIAVNEARARLRHDRVLKFESVDQSQTEEDGSFTPAVITDWRERSSTSPRRRPLSASARA
jgi:RNA polymerase sigma-70 factor (ECF subfamily)